jgi:glycosyltransferase involved in cell wall biosynthesis
LRLSAVVITHNEERDIGHALDAVAFADERVVVDSLSDDRTVEICRARGARVVSRPFGGYGPQKRFAVEQAAHDWVLCVDADELVDPELGAAIRALLAGDAPPRFAAYALPFRTVFMGEVLRHGARETHVRLFDRRRASWTDAPLHEHVVVDGPVGVLPGAVLHESVRDVSEGLGKLDRYTAQAALALRRRPRRGVGPLLLTVAWHFFRHFVLRRQFLNGVPGLAWATLHAVGSMMKYVKAHEHAPRPAATPELVAPPVLAPAPQAAPTPERASA